MLSKLSYALGSRFQDFSVISFAKLEAILCIYANTGPQRKCKYGETWDKIRLTTLNLRAPYWAKSLFGFAGIQKRLSSCFEQSQQSHPAFLITI